MSKKVFDRSLQAIQEKGFLLVFAMKDKARPSSLWSELYPNSVMSWDWDADGDNRVHQLWHIRQQLAESGEVVYGKFYKNRATFFSKKVFAELLSVAGSIESSGSWEANPTSSLEKEEPDFSLSDSSLATPLSRTAKELLEILEMDSPLSTKQLRKMGDLQGKDNERYFTKATTELWRKFLIVGVGEVDDGAFPSLAYASTKNYFEAEWKRALQLDPAESMVNLMSLSDAEGILEMLEKSQEI